MLLGTDSGRQSHIAFVSGKEYGNRPAQIANSKLHKVFFRVRTSGDKAAFNVDLDNFKDYFKWEGNPVDLMNRDMGPWATYMLQRPWIGCDASDVGFQKIRIRMLSGTIRRGLITKADRESDLKNGMVRLVGEKPKTASAKHWRILVNQTPIELGGEGPECRWPLVTRDFRFCDDYYAAHAPSTITCSIPPGAKSFSVIGYNDASRHAKFLVRVDGNQIHDSKETGIAVIKVDLPDNASLLELVADPAEAKEYDHTAWCYPRFHAVAANRITDQMLDEKPGPLEFTMTSGTGEFGVTSHQPFGDGHTAPVHFRDALPCDEFLFGHAPSTVTYEVPPNMYRFSAIGYNVLSHSVKYEVWADGERIFQSPLAGITKIDVPLPDGTKKIELRANPDDGEFADQSIWCYPRLHRN